MKDNLHTLIVPDVHARDFWREPVMDVLENSDRHVIFLGDYLDPYPYEWGAIQKFSGTSWDRSEEVKRKAIDGLLEIIELKKKYPNRITLLVGNHDCGYIDSSVCSCRRDRLNYIEIQRIFADNREQFQLADEVRIGDKHFVFSHAGISKKYAELCFGDTVNENNVVDFFNNAWFTNNYGVMDSLGIYDYYRGWGGSDYASLIWADLAEWGDEENTQHPQEGYGYMIFGHSQQEKDPVIRDKFACLDCRKAFYLDNDGNIQFWDGE